MRIIKKKNLENVLIEPISIIIPFSFDRVEDLILSLGHYNELQDISNFEFILVQYDNGIQEMNFDRFKNLNIKVIHSKRNNKDKR